ncbi:hypothetical protein WMF38_40320 [Sorangium sp. So ce118]
MLHRFWFEFTIDHPEDLPPGVRMGCGVTAHTVEEATALIRERVFGGAVLPRIHEVVPDIDVSKLDPGHVRPNMGNPVVRGIWFPLGY